MNTRTIVSAAGGNRLLFLASLCCLALLAAACQGSKEKSVADASEPDTSSTRKQLAYGVSVDTPQGWVVDGSVGPNEVTREQIKARLAEGKPAMLIAMHRTAGNNPNMADARFALLLGDALKIIPQKDAALPQEELDKRAQAIMQMYADLAEKEKRPNEVLDWKLSSEKIGGYSALLQQGTVQGKDGRKILIMTWYIYLPENVAVLVNAMGDPDVPDIANILAGLTAGIQVK